MLGRVGTYIQRGIFAATHAVTVLSLVSLAVLALITVADVFSRRFLNSTIVGTADIARFCLVIVVFAAFAYCETKKTHIAVDVLVQRFPQRAQHILKIFIQLCTVAILGVLSWQLFLYAIKLKNTGQVTSTLEIWFYPFAFIAAIGFTLFTLVLLVQLASSLHEVTRK